MFEDIIGDIVKNKQGGVPFAPTDEVCPSCKSSSIKFVNGILDSAYTYTQTLICRDCGTRWCAVYDDELNIIETYILS